MKVAALIFAAAASAAAAPSPRAPLPRDAAGVASALSATTQGLRSAEAEWSKSRAAPESVVLHALYQQRLYRLLARDTQLSRAELPQLAPPLRRLSADIVAAHRELYRLTPALRTVRIKVAAAP